MRYSRVFLDALGYELAPVVVSSEEIEARLASVYRTLHLSPGQLEVLTGIAERRWWEEGYPVSRGGTMAAHRALERSTVDARDLGVVCYTAVCRDDYEPATACHVAAELGVGESAAIYDISNACLGVLNGILDVANRIELGQIRAGLVVACESARDINELTIERLNRGTDLETYMRSLATFTGGSGAVAVILTDGSFSGSERRRLVGGALRNAPEHHRLCRWGVRKQGGNVTEIASTDSAGVLKHGVALGLETWHAFLDRLRWRREDVDRVICHQVGSSHRDTILEQLGIPAEKDFSTYPFLGNMGTASLPVTAALAEEREFLRPGDRVGWLGIGSGLNCLMLGWQW